MSHAEYACVTAPAGEARSHASETVCSLTRSGMRYSFLQGITQRNLLEVMSVFRLRRIAPFVGKVFHSAAILVNCTASHHWRMVGPTFSQLYRQYHFDYAREFARHAVSYRGGLLHAAAVVRCALCTYLTGSTGHHSMRQQMRQASPSGCPASQFRLHNPIANNRTDERIERITSSRSAASCGHPPGRDAVRTALRGRMVVALGGANRDADSGMPGCVGIAGWWRIAD